MLSWPVGGAMLTLQGEQVESLWDEVLPIEARELPDDLARLDRVLSDPALLGPVAAAWEGANRSWHHYMRGRTTTEAIPCLNLILENAVRSGGSSATPGLRRDSSSSTCLGKLVYATGTATL
jgi:hypothetical protein